MLRPLLTLAFCLVCAAAGAEPQRSGESACDSCHPKEASQRAAAAGIHSKLSCADCHPGRENPHVPPELSPELKARADSVREAARNDPGAMATCAKCHEEIFEQWRTTAHGPKKARAEIADHPTCERCHGPVHAVREAPKDKWDSLRLCAGCHAFAEEGRAPTSPFVVDTFRDTIHGKMLRLGDQEAAGCVDCHGSHAVLGSLHKDSPVHAENITATCAKCHEGATGSFARAISHEPPSVDHDLWAGVFSFFFSLLTLGCIGVLFVHVALDAAHGARMWIRGRKEEHLEPEEPSPVHRDDEVPRFDIHARIQHWGMMTSFTVLVLTGWPIKSASVGISGGLVRALGGPALLSTVHRGAGVLLLLVSLYHLAYLAWGFKRGRIVASMLPTPKDLKDVFDNVFFFLGLRKERPRFERFTYYEKFDYWAVFWGMVIMGGSGLILWFPVAFSRLLPGELVELALIAHSDEALLAALAIFLWHFYNVHLRPGIFPMSWVWITGRIPAHALYEEHRAEYEARYGSAPPADLGKPVPWQRHPAWSFAALGIVVFVGLVVAGQNLDDLRARIGEVQLPPELVEADEAARVAEAESVTVSIQKPAKPFETCAACHDSEEIDEGDAFPHKDHAEEHFDGEVEASCASCHELRWHEVAKTDRKMCLECHDEDELE